MQYEYEDPEVDGLELAEYPGMPGALAPRAAGLAVAAVEAARAEIESAITVAHRFPRQVSECIRGLEQDCARANLAKKARYSFRRGGSRIEGPSIVIMRAIALRWRNVRWGYDVLPDDEKHVTLLCWAWDLESNSRSQYPMRFRKAVQRKQPGDEKATWQDTDDERELRELTFRSAAFGIRNALRDVIPADVVDHALDACQRTVEKAARNALTKDRALVVRELVAAFDHQGVTVQMLNARLGHAVDDIDPGELAQMEAILRELMDGRARVADYFQRKAVDAQEAAAELLGGKPTGKGAAEPPKKG